MNPPSKKVYFDGHESSPGGERGGHDRDEGREYEGKTDDIRRF